MADFSSAEGQENSQWELQTIVKEVSNCVVNSERKVSDPTEASGVPACQI